MPCSTASAASLTSIATVRVTARPGTSASTETFLPSAANRPIALRQMLVAGLQRRGERDARAGRVVEREVEQHDRLARGGRAIGGGAPVAQRDGEAVDAQQAVPSHPLDRDLVLAAQQVDQRRGRPEVAFDPHGARRLVPAPASSGSGRAAPSR